MEEKSYWQKRMTRRRLLKGAVVDGAGLAEELPLNLAWLWFIGYDLDEDPPTHSVISKARSRFGESLYRAFFEEVVRLCEQAGLIR
ncbi:MAG: transposase [Dehalococcoidia bacterium]